MLLIIIQFLVVFLECLFLRTCVRISDNERKIPRLLLLLPVALSFIPILGIFIFFIVIVVAFIMREDLEIKDNRFTRFWWG
jgi:hypothetical protein